MRTGIILTVLAVGIGMGSVVAGQDNRHEGDRSFFTVAKSARQERNSYVRSYFSQTLFPDSQ